MSKLWLVSLLSLSKLENIMIFVLTGNGKGKTTCAIGMGIRAVGAKKKVLMIQFLKTKDSSSENKIIKRIKNFDLKTFGKKGFFVSKEYLKKHPQIKKFGVRVARKEVTNLIKRGFEFAKKAAISKKYNLLILDEACIVLNFGFIKKEEMIDFLKKYRKDLDIVLTGRGCPRKIIKISDLVTEMKEIKHYYKKGIKAREGIEY